MKKILGILTITLVLAACDKEQTNIHVVDEQNFSEYIEDIEKN
ncbi:membrane lipoprotein lipid attachment site-containing protein [Flavobacteriales bacterium]|nr:membrane lipoprotein lipid attachment site-containing protein [Flavobacteriales bacterium]